MDRVSYLIPQTSSMILTRQLRPDLGEDPNVRAVDHVWLEELEVCNISIIAFELAHLADVSQLSHDKGSIAVPMAVNESEHVMSFLPTIFAGEPTRRFGKRHHSEEEDDCRNHLETPWNAECTGTVDKGTAVGDVEHDHNTPGDCPLLSSYKTTTFAGWC